MNILKICGLFKIKINAIASKVALYLICPKEK